MNSVPNIQEEVAVILREFKGNTEKALEDFVNDTYGGNILEIVLRSHLYFENALENILRGVLKHPEFILNDRFTFSNKLSLVHSLGVIPDDFNSLIKYFNKNIRNKFAHNLKFEITEEHVNQLVNRFNKKVKEDYLVAYNILENISFPASTLKKELICCTYAIWANIRMYHRNYALDPFQEEINLLDSLHELGEKDQDDLLRFIEEREIKLLQKLKEFASNY